MFLHSSQEWELTVSKRTVDFLLTPTEIRELNKEKATERDKGSCHYDLM